MTRWPLVGLVVLGGCHLVFGLEDPTLGEATSAPANTSSAASGGVGGGAGGGAGGTNAPGGSGGMPVPCTALPCVAWSASLGHEDDGAVTIGALAVNDLGEVLVGGTFAGSIALGETVTATGTEGYVALLDDDGSPLAIDKIGGPGAPLGASALSQGWAVSGSTSGAVTLPGTCNNGGSPGFFLMVMDGGGGCTASTIESTGLGTGALVAARGSELWVAGRAFSGISFPGCNALGPLGTGAADMFTAPFSALAECSDQALLSDVGNATFSALAWPAPATAPAPPRALAGWGVQPGFSFGGDVVQGGQDSGFVFLFDNVDGLPAGALEFPVSQAGGLRAIDVAVSPLDGTVWVLAAFAGTIGYDSNAFGGPDYTVDATSGVDSVLFAYAGGGGYVGADPPPMIGGPGDQQAEAIAIDSLGNIYVAGRFEGTINLGRGPVAAAGGRDAFVLRHSSAAVLEWGARWGDANAQAATHLAVAPDDRVVVAGVYEGELDLGPVQLESYSAASAFVVELDPELSTR